MDFWRKTVAAGMDALGLDPQEFGVSSRPRNQQQQRRDPVPGDSMYVPPSHQMIAQAQQHPHHQPQQQQHAPGHYGGPAPGLPFVAPEDDKGREIERLRKELRKVEEKTNFFKNQVLALQQQVSSKGPPPSIPAGSMGVAGNAESAAELSWLRQELQQEQARTQQIRAQVSAATPANAQANGANSGREALEARVRELEQVLANARAGSNMSAGISSVATPTRSTTARRSLSGSDSPSMQALLGSSPSAPAHARSDHLDPSTHPGGATRVVIIGCNYPGQTGTLRACVTDSQQWARFFTKRCGVSEKDIRLLTDSPEQYTQPGREWSIATRDNIMRALQWLCSRSSSGDQLFFVFCGHGIQVVAEEYAGRKLCENSMAPTDVSADGGSQPRIVSDSDVHKALMQVASGAQATLIYDSCHAGSPLDRAGLNYLTEHVKRGTVDYEKLKSHPVLPRFLELGHWKVRSNPPEAVRESNLRCQAVQWAACDNEQFCVELPIEDQARGVFTYMFMCALLKEGVSASSESLLREMRSLTSSLKGRWRLQQDIKMVVSRSTSGAQKFLR